MQPGPIPTLVAGGYLGDTSSFCIGHRSGPYRYGIGVGISFLRGFAATGLPDVPAESVKARRHFSGSVLMHPARLTARLGGEHFN